MDFTYTGLKKPGRGDGVRIEDLNFNTDRVTVSNKNLLLNWDFRNPVNQRGQMSYTGLEYSVDRWRIANPEGRLNVKDGYITLFGEGNHCWLCQPIESSISLTGKALTFSVMLINGEVYSCTSIWGSGYVLMSDGLQCEWRNDSVNIVVSNGYSLNIAAAKLELGPISTLANDPPANYGEQLALCQRYCQRFEGFVGFKQAASDSVIYPSVRLKTQMRVPPSLASYFGAGITDDYSWFPVAEISMNYHTTKDVAIIQCISSGLNPARSYDVKCDSIVFDAEIY